MQETDGELEIGSKININKKKKLNMFCFLKQLSPFLNTIFNQLSQIQECYNLVSQNNADVAIYFKKSRILLMF